MRNIRNIHTYKYLQFVEHAYLTCFEYSTTICCTYVEFSRLYIHLSTYKCISVSYTNRQDHKQDLHHVTIL